MQKLEIEKLNRREENGVVSMVDLQGGDKQMKKADW